jgi:transcriptional regulator
MPVERIEVKIKMNQNRTAADRAKVVAMLRASGRAGDTAVAEWIVVDE